METLFHGSVQNLLQSMALFKHLLPRGQFLSLNHLNMRSGVLSLLAFLWSA